MYPLLKNGQKILCISFFSNLYENDIVVFKHKQEGLMIKKIAKIDENGYYVKGTTAFSLDSSVFGYLKKDEILYKMFFKF
ncbi:MAG: hypothetical protein GY932_02820 [Arcobacter sp.]|nr:hypothetical protein [Arcobacter sp.]